jgi:hypothetical protein
MLSAKPADLINLVVTAIISDVKINDRPDKVRELVGGSMDLSVGKYVYLNFIIC